MKNVPEQNKKSGNICFMGVFSPKNQFKLKLWGKVQFATTRFLDSFQTRAKCDSTAYPRTRDRRCHSTPQAQGSSANEAQNERKGTST